jgi:hexokinase
MCVCFIGMPSCKFYVSIRMHQPQSSCILHSGTNCCYLEQLSNIPKYHQQFLPRTSDMVVNTVSSCSAIWPEHCICIMKAPQISCMPRRRSGDISLWRLCCGQEWADYTSDCLPWLQEDRELDADSRYPGSHHFEKMTAGLYMGNLARLIILRQGAASAACLTLILRILVYWMQA